VLHSSVLASLRQSKHRTRFKFVLTRVVAIVALHNRFHQAQCSNRRHSDSTAIAAHVLYMYCIQGGSSGSTVGLAACVVMALSQRPYLDLFERVVGHIGKVSTQHTHY
jgi:hypothetical protein